MTLIVLLLLVIVVLAAITRIVDSRPVTGLGMLALAMVLMLVLGVVSYSERSVPAPRSVVTGIAVDPVPSATANESVAEAEAEDAMDEESDEPETSEPEAEETEPQQAEPQEAADPAPGELSSDITVETGEIIIPPRPDWVEADEVQTGDIHTVAVSSGPHETERECRKALDRELQEAVERYIDWRLGPVYDERFRPSRFVRYELDEIEERLIPPGKIYHEVIQVSFGPMHQMHAQLAFDPAFRRELDGRRSELQQHWKQWIVQQRLVTISVGFGLLLVLMGVVFAYFRLDTATRGFYSRPLKWAASAVIAAVVGAAIVVAGLLFFVPVRATSPPVSWAAIWLPLPLVGSVVILILLTVGAVLAGRMLQK